MKVIVTDQDITNTHKKLNSLFWRFENWLQKVFIPYARLPVFIVVGFLLLAAGDFIYYGDKKDISALPKPAQERYNSLVAERGEMRKNRWELEAQKKYTQATAEINLEINQIYASAPYASWGRSVINNTKEILCNIKPQN